MAGEDDDSASLSRVLDDAASRELSINGLHDDLTSLSCGYTSLDAHSDARSHSSSGEESHAKSRAGSERWSWRRSSGGSHRTSKSSIKSSDNLDEEQRGHEVPPSLPPALPPCDTCEDRSSTSSSCFTATSSSVLSCTTCAAESDAAAPHPEVDVPRQQADAPCPGADNPHPAAAVPSSEVISCPPRGDVAPCAAEAPHPEADGSARTSAETLHEQETPTDQTPSEAPTPTAPEAPAILSNGQMTPQARLSFLGQVSVHARACAAARQH